MAPAGYSGTPLWKKLGFRAGALVITINPPDGYRDWLDGAPEVRFGSAADLAPAQQPDRPAPAAPDSGAQVSAAKTPATRAQTTLAAATGSAAPDLDGPDLDGPDLDGPDPRGSFSASPAAADLVHLFVFEAAELAACLPALRTAIAPAGMIWVSWPKKSARRAPILPGALTEDRIRDIALPLGLVDVKVCAVSDIWSGLKLVIRKELR